MAPTILCAGQQRRHRPKEQALGLSRRRRGRDDLREQPWNMYITVCEIDDQCKFDAQSRHAWLVLWDNLKGRGGEGGGRGAEDGGYVHIHGGFTLTYGKNHHSIVKQLPSSQIN